MESGWQVCVELCRFLSYDLSVFCGSSFNYSNIWKVCSFVCCFKRTAHRCLPLIWCVSCYRQFWWLSLFCQTKRNEWTPTSHVFAKFIERKFNWLSISLVLVFAINFHRLNAAQCNKFHWNAEMVERYNKLTQF